MNDREPNYGAGFLFAIIFFLLLTFIMLLFGIGQIGGIDVAKLLMMMSFAVVLIVLIAVKKLKDAGWDEAL